EGCVGSPTGNDEVARRMRREVWTAWWRATDGPVLLEELRKRTLDEAALERATALIGKLGDPVVEVRDKAMSELVGMGGLVIPLVRRAGVGGHSTLAPTAQKSLQLLTARTTPSPLPSCAPRLLAVRRPAGAVETLLAYLPFADDEGVLVETESALQVLAVHDGKPEPAIVRALEDRAPQRPA